MAEFSVIEHYCKTLGAQHEETQLGVGDDAAVVSVPKGHELAISVDTMVEGTHFFPDTEPSHLAYKILAVNLSDMASMGAQPKWATLSLCINQLDEAWLDKFYATIDTVAQSFGVQIIGGDTSEGPTALSLTIIGLLPIGKRLTRSGAKVGDAVYCTGVLGDAALAIAGRLGELTLTPSQTEILDQALNTPRPKVALGKYLLNIVSSCIDISDGLIGDAGHIAKASNVTINIETRLLPLSDTYLEYMQQGGFIKYAIVGGDDYQLLFTVPPENVGKIEEVAKLPEVRITQIGTVIKQQQDPVVLLQDGKPSVLKLKSFQHFS